MLFAVDARWVKGTWRGTSLMVQWLSIHPPMQGTRIRSLVREDSTCCRTTNPVVTTAELELPGARDLRQEKPRQREARAPQLERSPCSLQPEQSQYAATNTQRSQRTNKRIPGGHQQQRRHKRHRVLPTSGLRSTSAPACRALPSKPATSSLLSHTWVKLDHSLFLMLPPLSLPPGLFSGVSFS